MFYFDNPITLPYLGAILCLLYVALIWKRHPEEEEKKENE